MHASIHPSIVHASRSRSIHALTQSQLLRRRAISISIFLPCLRPLILCHCHLSHISPNDTPITMLPTPVLSHLQESDYDLVYEPAEDSFALLDALEQELPLLRSLHPLPFVLEIGSGTGIVSAFLQQSVFEHSLHLCTDNNHFACQTTQRTSAVNTSGSSTTSLDSVRTSLSHGLRLQNVNLIVFNPPYVPTCHSEIDSHRGTLTASWAGGRDGMSVTSEFISLAADLLAPNGLFYLVAVARNRPEVILEAAKLVGLVGDMILQRRAGREKLVILRFSRISAIVS